MSPLLLSRAEGGGRAGKGRGLGGIISFWLRAHAHLPPLWLARKDRSNNSHHGAFIENEAGAALALAVGRAVDY